MSKTYRLLNEVIKSSQRRQCRIPGREGLGTTFLNCNENTNRTLYISSKILPFLKTDLPLETSEFSRARATGQGGYVYNPAHVKFNVYGIFLFGI